jgi:uncharacterized protein
VSAATYCHEQGIAANFFCTQNTGPEIEENGISVVKNSDIAGSLNNCCVVGTTAWGFCRADLTEEFDYLFVDEAGQVALAKLIGMSRSARNLILMGDQMQLGQPIQGTHPAESGASILDYLLHDTAIIPAEMGVFLGTTFRMHSSVNAFISEAIYEGQLLADSSNDNQSVVVPENYKGVLDFSSGFQFIPVHHEGNTQASDEEVKVISALAQELLGRTYIDKKGQQKPVGWEDILFIAPYNHQVNKLKDALGQQAKIGSVDKFQGQEAPIVFFSLCTSDAAESARGIDFIFDKQRINVAMSRAQAMAIVVGNPALFSAPVGSLSHMRKINVLAHLVAH